MSTALYVLLDLSTNGTFVNGSDLPLGRANSQVLSEGDRIGMGDYQFAVRMSGEEAPAASHSIDVDDPAAYPFGLEPRRGSPAGPVPAWQSEPKPERSLRLPGRRRCGAHLGTAGRTGPPAGRTGRVPPAHASRNFSEIPEDWAETPTAAPGARPRAGSRPILGPIGAANTPTPPSPAPQPPAPQPPAPQPPPLPVAPAPMPAPRAADPPPRPLPPREPPPEPRPAPMPPAPISAPPAIRRLATAGDTDLLSGG